jgi:hypothetical protein
MLSRIFKLLGFIPALFGAVVIAMAQVGPSDAEQNLCKWLKLIYPNAADACLHGIPSFWIYFLSVILLIVGIIWLLFPILWTLFVSFRQQAKPFPSKGPELEEVKTFYHSWLYPAAENINQVMRRVMIAMRKHSDAAVRSHEGLIQRSIVDEERTALARLSNALRGIEPTSDADLQERLGGYYRNYQNNRTWVSKGIKLTGLNLAHDAIFQEWRRLDADFLRELRRLSGPSRYDRLHQLIQEVGWGETVTRDIDGAIK